MVAASKLHNCKSRLEYARSFFAETERIIGGVDLNDELVDNIYLQPNETNVAAYLIVTGDRGMCGSYNSNLLECARRHMNGSGKDIRLLTIGGKGYDYYRRNKKDVSYRFVDMLETAFYEDAVRISHYLRNLFSLGEVDEINVAYTEFESVFTHTPRIKRILPIVTGAACECKTRPMKYDIEISSYLDHAIPSYLNAFVYTAMLESVACENAARTLSMDSAVNNATDIIDKLTRAYNRNRQTAITQEISEIIAGWQ